MLLFESPEMTLTGDLDNQGRLSSVAAVVRVRIHARAISGAEVLFDGILEVGEHSRNIPTPRRIPWAGEDPQYSLSVVAL